MADLAGNREYIIRYGIVPPGTISNDVIVKNPYYGKPIGPWGSRPVRPALHMIEHMNRKNGFYIKLEESILKEGIRNPIFCNSYKEGTFCRYGTSRLWFAKKHNIEVPVIIADYISKWDGLEELKTREDVLSKFIEPPEILEIADDEMRFDKCSHYHLEDQWNYDG